MTKTSLELCREMASGASFEPRLAELAPDTRDKRNAQRLGERLLERRRVWDKEVPLHVLADMNE